MVEVSAGKVVNCHWYGGSDKLPADTIYIGRPSLYGNPYSSKSGLITREEAIALHRIDLYRYLTNNPGSIDAIRKDLEGHDLACWCKQPNRIIGCHGDTYLHVLSDRLRYRKYDESIFFYLLDDLKHVLSLLRTRVMKDVSHDDFLRLDIQLSEVKLDTQYGLIWSREKDLNLESVYFFVACVLVDLELAIQETDLSLVEYHFAHASWICFRFTNQRQDRFMEPSKPDLPLGKKKVKKKGLQDGSDRPQRYSVATAKSLEG